MRPVGNLKLDAEVLRQNDESSEKFEIWPVLIGAVRKTSSDFFGCMKRILAGTFWPRQTVLDLFGGSGSTHIYIRKDRQGVHGRVAVLEKDHGSFHEVSEQSTIVNA